MTVDIEHLRAQLVALTNDPGVGKPIRDDASLLLESMNHHALPRTPGFLPPESERPAEPPPLVAEQLKGTWMGEGGGAVEQQQPPAAAAAPPAPVSGPPASPALAAPRRMSEMAPLAQAMVHHAIAANSLIVQIQAGQAPLEALVRVLQLNVPTTTELGAALHTRTQDLATWYLELRQLVD